MSSDLFTGIFFLRPDLLLISFEKTWERHYCGGCDIRINWVPLLTIYFFADSGPWLLISSGNSLFWSLLQHLCHLFLLFLEGEKVKDFIFVGSIDTGRNDCSVRRSGTPSLQRWRGPAWVFVWTVLWHFVEYFNRFYAHLCIAWKRESDCLRRRVIYNRRTCNKACFSVTCTNALAMWSHPTTIKLGNFMALSREKCEVLKSTKSFSAHYNCLT